MFKYELQNETELRLLEARHAGELFALTDQSRVYLREWLPWVDFTKTIDDSRQFIEAGLKQFSSNNGFQAGIWYKGELAGVIGLHHINWANKATSIGYWLGEKFQGNGLMTLACRALVDYCFMELQLNRIEIRVAVKNQKSMAIPMKLGFQQEGCLRGVEWLYDHYVDHAVFGLTKEEYLKQGYIKRKKMIKGLYEAHLPVKNLEASLAFYQKLGLELAWRDDNTAFFWIEKGKSWLGLWEGEEVQTPYHPSLRHIAFRVPYEDMKNSLTWLESIGVEAVPFGKRDVIEPFIRPNQGNASVYFIDPDGNSLELMCSVEVPEEFSHLTDKLSFEEWEKLIR